MELAQSLGRTRSYLTFCPNSIKLASFCKHIATRVKDRDAIGVGVSKNKYQNNHLNVYFGEKNIAFGFLKITLGTSIEL